MEITNRFAALGNLIGSEDINMVWGTLKRTSKPRPKRVYNRIVIVVMLEL